MSRQDYALNMNPGSTRPRRVVHISFGLDVGGQEKLLVEFARHGNHDRFSLTFVSLGGRGDLASDLEACGATVVALGEPCGLKPCLICRLARLFLRLHPAAIHTHDHRALFYAGPAALLAGVPRVINTRHGRNVHFTRRQVLVGRHLARLVDHYVCVSSDVRAQCLIEGIDPERLGTILNGIDVERFAFCGPCLAGPVIAVARLSPEKDVANLVRASAIAAQRDAELRVVIAGDGPCMGELRQLVAELRLSDRVSLLGQVKDISSLMGRGSLFVLPSLSEGVSLTLLEAMARGLPGVATRVGGTSEVVVEGETGVLVPPADPAALAEAILRVRSNSELGRRMGEAGRRRVEQVFDIRRMVADYEAMYLEPHSPRKPAAVSTLPQASR